MNSGGDSPTIDGAERRPLWRIGAGVLLGALVWLIAADGSGSIAGAQRSSISVAVEAREASATCAPRGSALRHERVDTPTSFTLVVIADRQLCDPVTAIAAVYAMPGDGAAWPQTLLERRDVVIGSAGTYRFSFDKTCQPAQFDVLTGDTPETIAPWGHWHGPLLFPFDLTTAFQHWAPGCAPATTTTAAPTTTVVPTTAAPTTATPNTATPNTTAPTTVGTDRSSPDGTEPEPDGTADVFPSTDDVEVLGVATPNTPGGPRAVGAAQDPTSQSADVAGLAFTGASSVVLALVGFALLVSGIAMLLSPRLRSRRYWAYL